MVMAWLWHEMYFFVRNTLISAKDEGKRVLLQNLLQIIASITTTNATTTTTTTTTSIIYRIPVFLYCLSLLFLFLVLNEKKNEASLKTK